MTTLRPSGPKRQASTKSSTPCVGRNAPDSCDAGPSCSYDARPHGCLAMAAHAQQVAKSAKRRAAEALLAARFGAASASPFPAPLRPTPHPLTAALTDAAPDCGCGAPGLLAYCATVTVRHLSTFSAPSSYSSGAAGAGAAGADSDDSAVTGPGPSPSGQQASGLGQGPAGSASQPGLTPGPLPAPLPPPSKRPRVDLAAAAASSLGGHRHSSAAAATGTAAAAKSPSRPALTTVPPCDPARGCGAAAPSAACGGSTRPGAQEAGAGAGPASGGNGTCAASRASSPSGPGSGAGAGFGWCSFEVRVPSVDWQTVFDEPPASMARTTLARGYERLRLPEGLTAYLIEDPKHTEDALAKLRAGMQDRLLAIDLEWRPETVAGRTSPVALLQLSSASTVLLFRVCAWGYGMPPALKAFLTEPGPVVLGFGWDSADEAKMKSTFGLGRAGFRRFLDLQVVASTLGYHGFGLARLAARVLGVPLQKSKHVSRSNWAAPSLSPHQIKYACLDVLVAGQLFRALRLWHSSPSPCASCRQPIGEVLPTHGSLRCGHPACAAAKPACSLPRHSDHCAATGHAPRFGACAACGRVYELAAAGGGAAAGTKRPRAEAKSEAPSESS